MFYLTIKISISIKGGFLTRECGFYLEFEKTVNEKLAEAGLEKICVPKCYFGSLKCGIIVMEDLRTRDYEMMDRRKGDLKINKI